MSLPTCFSLLNLSYFTNLQSQIAVVKTEAELQALVDKVFSDISMLESTITSQIAKLAPLLGLVTAPTSPSEVITWIGTFITGFLTPYLIPYATMAAQLTALATQVALLTTEINNAASRLGVSITIPAITIGCTL